MTDANAEPVEVEVRTAGGVTLRADLFLPAGTPCPLLVAASPYQKALRHLPVHPAFPFRETGPIGFYVEHGYAYLWLDVPGSGRSEGTWEPVSRAEGEAIAEVVEWAAAQDWCTGDVGMIGQSYFCWSAWNVARVGAEHLRTIVAFDGSTDLYRDWMYRGGIPDLGFGTSWAATVMLQHQATGHPIDGGDRDRFVPDMYRHPLDDAWHRTRSPFWELDSVTIPVLSIGSWIKGPLHLRGNVEGFRRVAGPRALLVLAARSPNEVQSLYASEEFHAREIMPWYDRYLKGAAPEPPATPGSVRVQVNRSGVLRHYDAWPPRQTIEAVWHLTGRPSGTTRSLNDGSLTEGAAHAEEDLASTSWSYPYPRWRVGTTVIDDRGAPDHVGGVLTFTSPPMEADREFTGDGYLSLYCSTDQTDMDVVVRLAVLGDAPVGGGAAAERVTQGWLRASHREEDAFLSTPMRPFHSHRRLSPVEPGQVYELRIALLPMSFLVRAGERLRLEISNGDSPLTEGRLFQWYGLKAGTDTYYHSPTHPSRLHLPEQRTPAASLGAADRS